MIETRGECRYIRYVVCANAQTVPRDSCQKGPRRMITSPATRLCQQNTAHEIGLMTDHRKGGPDLLSYGKLEDPVDNGTRQAFLWRVASALPSGHWSARGPCHQSIWVPDFFESIDWPQATVRHLDDGLPPARRTSLCAAYLGSLVSREERRATGAREPSPGLHEKLGSQNPFSILSSSPSPSLQYIRL